MSTFLGFDSYLVNLGSTVLQARNAIMDRLTYYGWRITRKSVDSCTVMATSTLTNYANAVNLATQSSAGDAGAMPRWVGVQLGSAYTPTVMYLSANAESSVPTAFSLDYSDNGTSWTTQQSWSGEINWSAGEKRKFTISGASAHVYWRLNLTTKLGSNCYVSEWMLENASGECTTTKHFFDAIPPVTETIGNSMMYEFIRFYVSSTLIQVKPMIELLQNIPEVFSLDTPVAGAVTLSLTIGASTVSYVGSSGNTAIQNQRGLYEAIRASSDPLFTAWNWWWWPKGTYIIATQKTPAKRSVTISSSNISFKGRGKWHEAMHLSYGSCGVNSVTIDIINGFIYYLQVNSRGLALAIKTNSGFTGPIHMCYGNNSEAISQLPTADNVNIPCMPIELLVGTDDANVNQASGVASVTHWWGVSSAGTDISSDMENTYGGAHPAGHFNFANQLQDWSGGIGAGGSTSLSLQSITMRGEGIFAGTDSGSGYVVHKLACDPDNIWAQTSISANTCRACGPVYSTLDWYRICGTITDEQLIMTPSLDYTCTLTADTNTTDTTITVNNTTGFPSSGYIVLDSEVVQYIGITSTSFTGCTRGSYGTSASNHYVGDISYIVAWFVKIQYGALFAGYQKPV